MRESILLQKLMQVLASVLCFASYTTAVYANRHNNQVDSIGIHDIIKTKIELTQSGDTITHYYYDPVDFDIVYEDGNKMNSKSRDNSQRLLSSSQGGGTDISIGTVNTANRVDKIAFNENVTPTGGKVVSIPIITVKVNSSAPQISLVYNSQGGNSVAGYGWGISGLSSISVVNKNIYYDGNVNASDLSKPEDCVFALDATRLLNVSEVNIPDYQYVTAQGFTYIRKVMSGNHVSYFEALYSNGSKATFGFVGNDRTRYSYPITSIVDIKGYRIDFEYISSGNNYYISKVRYGSKTMMHPAEIIFEYENRTDCYTSFVYGVSLCSDKLLKKIVSKHDSQELRSYSLAHTFNGSVNQLTKLDCSVETSSLNPLTFGVTCKSLC